MRLHHRREEDLDSPLAKDQDRIRAIHDPAHQGRDAMYRKRLSRRTMPSSHGRRVRYGIKRVGAEADNEPPRRVLATASTNQGGYRMDTMATRHIDLIEFAAE